MNSLFASNRSTLLVAVSISLATALGFLAGVAAGPPLLARLQRRRRRRRRLNEASEAQKETPVAGDDNVDNNNNNSSNPSLAEAEAHLWKIVEHSFTGALIYAGDKLDIYRLLSTNNNNNNNNDRRTAASLAAQTGWSERWLREFLAQAAAAGLCTYDDNDDTQAFRLKPAYAKLLQGPETSQQSLAGMFQLLHCLLSRADAVVESIQTGRGFDYDFVGVGGSSSSMDNVSQAIDRKNGNFFRHHLVNDILSQVKLPINHDNDGDDLSAPPRTLVDLLECSSSNDSSRSIVNVADIGCGCGSSTLAMAKRFPNSRFFAYETSAKSLEILKERIQRDNIDNVVVCNVHERTVGDGPVWPGPSGQDDNSSNNNKFSFVYAHDVLHDMTDPRALLQDIRKRLSDEGCCVIVDVACEPTLAGNIAKPNGALLYGFSCLLCLASATSSSSSSSTSNKASAGLGTCGLHASLLQQWARECGFLHFQQMKIKSLPSNVCYIIA